MLGLVLAAALAVAPMPTKLVFESTRDGDFELYAANPDGSGVVQLTRNDDEDSSPLPSPDGRTIVFYSATKPGGVVAIAADGTGRHVVPGCGGVGAYDMSWAPDSSALACQGAQGGIVISSATGVRRLSELGVTPSWSPDGARIAYVEEQALRIVDVASGTIRTLVRGGVESAKPAWSPDSRRLAYYLVARGENYLDLHVIDRDGTGDRRLVKRVGDDLEPPAWSPDGRWIAFTRPLPHFVQGIFVVSPAGTGLRRLTPRDESSTAISWSPDGTRIAYTRRRYAGSDYADVATVPIAGGAPRSVTRPFPEGGSNDAARWAPGAPPVAPPPQKLATVAARPARTLVFDGPVASLAADGARAVAYSTSNCGGVTVWNGATGARRRTPRLCDRDAHLGELALAGRRLAWISYFGSNTGLYQDLWDLAPGARKPGHLAFALAYEDGGGDELSGLVGSGATLAFTSTDVRSGSVRLWRVAARRAAHCPETASEESTGSANRCVRLRAGDGAGPTSVDRGRIAAVGRDRVVVVGSDGRLVRALAVPGASAAAIAGDRVAVQAGPSVAVYSVSTGARVAARSLTRTGTPPALLGLRGDVAIYVSGAAVHLLRLSTGRDVALTVPGLAPPVTARLTGAGLFLLYNRLYARSPGRLAFVPFRAATP